MWLLLGRTKIRKKKKKPNTTIGLYTNKSHAYITMFFRVQQRFCYYNVEYRFKQFEHSRYTRMDFFFIRQLLQSMIEKYNHDRLFNINIFVIFHLIYCLRLNNWGLGFLKWLTILFK